jgi:hypothetical protein
MINNCWRCPPFSRLHGGPAQRAPATGPVNTELGIEPTTAVRAQLLGDRVGEETSLALSASPGVVCVLHHPLEPGRVCLGHGEAHDDDAVRGAEVLLVVRRPAATEGGSQTGNRGGVSNAGLVLDLQRASAVNSFLIR